MKLEWLILLRVVWFMTTAGWQLVADTVSADLGLVELLESLVNDDGPTLFSLLSSLLFEVEVFFLVFYCILSVEEPAAICLGWSERGRGGSS